MYYLFSFFRPTFYFFIENINNSKIIFLNIRCSHCNIIGTERVSQTFSNKVTSMLISFYIIIDCVRYLKIQSEVVQITASSWNLTEYNKMTIKE